MKRIAVLTALVALLGTSVAAFAAEPCGCQAQKCTTTAKATLGRDAGPTGKPL